ncbi:hypothetical protein [Arthrobacter sp. NPDC057013]|uniref:hypothetical protein n=1 Tax=Arthrobacter sp. NPDC057013 TaxID=3345999 RepID=UPI003645000A
MSDRAHDEDLWQEFEWIPPAGRDRIQGLPGELPQGFGFRTGVRGAKVALGFAVFALALGTVLVLTGAVVFISQGHWLMLGLMVLIEVVFILAFSRLVRLARIRRLGH